MSEPVSTAELYLDAMKRVLTREGLGPAYTRYAAPDTQPKKKAIIEGAQKLLSKRNLGLVQVIPDPERARRHGLFFPMDAETMIGRRRLDHLHECIRVVLDDGVQGDFIETGAWRGGVTIFMRAALAAYNDQRRRVWVADSFQGLPRPREEHPEDAGDRHWANRVFDVSVDEVRENFERFGLLDDQVRFLPGWFSDTLSNPEITELAILRLDGDMYGSTMDALVPLYDKVRPGGFIIVDDYGLPGCRQAVLDFRRDRDITEPILEVEEPDSPHHRPAGFWRKQ